MSSIPWYDLNGFDYGIIAVVCISTVVSFFRGFVRELLSLVIWIAGIILAFKYAPDLQHYIQSVTKWGALSYVISFGLIFLGVWILGLLLTMALRSVITHIGLGGADRMAGLFFGFARGFLVVVMVLMFINVSPFKKSTVVKASVLVPVFSGIVATLEKYVPKDVSPLAKWEMKGK